MEEESCEVHSEENKALTDKNKKRKLKTPDQVKALEKFYNEHKYPSEELKLQFAEKIGLTEKQVSGWFCHRRLKDKKRDEACANGRQDRSSGIIQDRGSGLKQDSCGSTKQGDYKYVDPREVESRRLYGNDHQALDASYGHLSHYSGMDDSSSESSSALQDSHFLQSEVPCDAESSRYLAENGIIFPPNAKGVGNRGSGRPSGYLKVKGEVENAAITAVKRQLGRHYREDGPPLGVEFQPLPPGSFELPEANPAHESYFSGDHLAQSPDIDGVHRQASLKPRYEAYNPKMTSPDSYVDRMNFRSMDSSDQEKYSHYKLKQKSSLPNYGQPFTGRNSPLDLNDDSAGETSVYHTSRKHGMRSKHGSEEMRAASVSNHSALPYGGKISSGSAEPWLDDYDHITSKVVQRKEQLESKSSNLIRRAGESFDTEDMALSKRVTKKDKSSAERRIMKEHSDVVRMNMSPTGDIRVGKRGRDEFSQLDDAPKTSVPGLPTWTNHAKGGPPEIPSSFSEDETGETSSSMG
ncbi:Homeobox domain [Dillenia turbinata]|uniref:Homeobox domain n=1 Tax=Dillenia turbinata TaxID=194707 RepID=A0AAN8Z5G4_9MAGN